MITDLTPQGMPMVRPCDICHEPYPTYVAAIWYPMLPEDPIRMMPARLTCNDCGR